MYDNANDEAKNEIKEKWTRIGNKQHITIDYLKHNKAP